MSRDTWVSVTWCDVTTLASICRAVCQYQAELGKHWNKSRFLCVFLGYRDGSGIFSDIKLSTYHCVMSAWVARESSLLNSQREMFRFNIFHIILIRALFWNELQEELSGKIISSEWSNAAVTVEIFYRVFLWALGFWVKVLVVSVMEPLHIAHVCCVVVKHNM